MPPKSPLQHRPHPLSQSGDREHFGDQFHSRGEEDRDHSVTTAAFGDIEATDATSPASAWSPPARHPQ